MALTRTLAQMLNRCAKEADIVLGADSTSRHETTDAVLYINDSYRSYLTLLTTRGFDFALAETAQANLPTSRADTNEQYSLIDWPSGAIMIKRVDVYSDGEWHELDRRDWTNLRSEWRSGSSNGARRPLVFAPKSHGSVTTTTFTAGKIALAPFSSNGKYKVTYQPEWTDIASANTTYLFLFADEIGCQWVIWDFVVKISARDRDNKKRHDIAVTERAHCEALIGHFVPHMIQTGSSSVIRSPSYNR
jgi:hypothetical protein